MTSNQTEAGDEAPETSLAGEGEKGDVANDERIEADTDDSEVDAEAADADPGDAEVDGDGGGTDDGEGDGEHDDYDEDDLDEEGPSRVLLVVGAAVAFVAIAIVGILIASGGDSGGGGNGNAGNDNAGNDSRTDVGIFGTTDQFDRPDSATALGDFPPGRPWSADAGTWGIQNDEAYLVDSAEFRNHAVVGLGQGDGGAQVRLDKVVNGAGLVFRYVGPYNYWAVVAVPDVATWNIIKVVEGDQEVVGNTGQSPTADGTTVGVRLRGDTIEVIVNGRVRKTIVDDFQVDAGKVGITARGPDSGDARWDDFVAGLPNGVPLSSGQGGGAGAVRARGRVDDDHGAVTSSSAAPSRSEPDRYFPCIDGLRAAAAVMVVAFHVAGPVTGVNAGDTWLADYTNQLGRLGVSIFFAISGFLLYRPFVVAHLDGRPAPAVGPYLRRRFLRIFPAYWLALAAFAVLASPVIRDSITDNLALRIALLQGYSRTQGLTGIAVAWTLTIELTFYVVLPGFAWLVRRLGAALGRDHRLVAEWIGLAVLYAIGVIARTLVTHKVAAGPLAGFLAWTDLFAMGMLIAVVRARQKAGGGLPAAFRYLGRYPLLGVVLALELVWVVALLDLPTGFAERTLTDELARHVCYGLVGFLLLAPLVFGNQQRTAYRKLLQWRPVRWTGEVSYGLYLWHLLVLYLLTKGFARGETLSFWPLFGTTLGITMVIASASYVLLERPIQHVRFRHLVPSRGPSRSDQDDQPAATPAGGSPPP